MTTIKEKYLSKINDAKIQNKIEIIFQDLKNDFQFRKDYTCFIFDDITFTVQALVYKNFFIKENEKMLLFRVRNKEAYSSSFWSGPKLKREVLDYCYLITDSGFHYRNGETIIEEPWENILKFKYDGRASVGVYIRNVARPIHIYSLFSYGEGKKYCNLINDICKYYSKIYGYRLNLGVGKVSKALKQIEKLLESNIVSPQIRYDKGNALMNYIENGKKCKFYGLISLPLKPIEIHTLLSDAEREFNYLLYSKQSEIKKEIPFVYYQKSKIARYNNNILQQRRFLINAMATEDYTLQTQIQNDMNEADLKIKDVYTDMDYNERKIIMLVKEINKECSTNTIEVFKIDNYPSKIQFPKGHPKLGELYIGHPYRNNLYIPYANHEFQFFLDKVYEYCQLLQALGATEITIESIRGMNVSELQKYNFNASGGANYGPAAKVNAEYNEKKESSSKSSVDNYLKEYRKMDPMSLPHIPDNLIWYPEQTTWQRLASQRTNNNNLLEFEEEFSTKETSFVSASEEESIKADLQILKFSANLNVNESNLKQSERSEETVWRIKVKFKSLADFVISKSGISSNFMLSQNEDNYRAEVLYCIKENAGISEIDRRILNRKREQLGITEERAREIEESCMPKYTDNEREYLGILEALDGLDLNDPIVQKRIIRERSLLNISEQRADELEAQFNKRKNE